MRSKNEIQERIEHIKFVRSAFNEGTIGWDGATDRVRDLEWVLSGKKKENIRLNVGGTINEKGYILETDEEKLAQTRSYLDMFIRRTMAGLTPSPKEKALYDSECLDCGEKFSLGGWLKHRMATHHRHFRDLNYKATIHFDESKPTVTVTRAVNISKDPDALFDTGLSAEDWEKKYGNIKEKCEHMASADSSLTLRVEGINCVKCVKCGTWSSDWEKVSREEKINATEGLPTRAPLATMAEKTSGIYFDDSSAKLPLSTMSITKKAWHDLAPALDFCLKHDFYINGFRCPSCLKEEKK